MHYLTHFRATTEVTSLSSPNIPCLTRQKTSGGWSGTTMLRSLQCSLTARVWWEQRQCRTNHFSCSSFKKEFLWLWVLPLSLTLFLRYSSISSYCLLQIDCEEEWLVLFLTLHIRVSFLAGVIDFSVCKPSALEYWALKKFSLAWHRWIHLGWGRVCVLAEQRGGHELWGFHRHAHQQGPTVPLQWRADHHPWLHPGSYAGMPKNDLVPLQSSSLFPLSHYRIPCDSKCGSFWTGHLITMC